MPPNTVYVGRGRGSKFGNPYRVGASDPILIGSVMDVSACVRMFEWYAAQRLHDDPAWLDELRGKDLACWCKEGEPCHADVLLEIANG